jgi:hypothetical protein
MEQFLGGFARVASQLADAAAVIVVAVYLGGLTTT